MYKKHLKNETEMLLFGAQLAAAVANGLIIFLEGPLGAGKTTLARGFLRGLGYHDKVKSPTYTLVEPYDITDKTIFHFDFYRINDVSELEQIGIREYFFDESICLIEWPEKGFPLLPQPDLTCYISLIGNEREIKIKAHSARGEACLKNLD